MTFVLPLPLPLPLQIIDDTHNCFVMKYLRNKPVRELKGDEFLRLHLAEQDHLLEIKISIDLEQQQEKRSVHECVSVCMCVYVCACACI